MTAAIQHHTGGASAQYKSAMLLSREEIAPKVASLGRAISRGYDGNFHLESSNLMVGRCARAVVPKGGWEESPISTRLPMFAASMG